MPLIKDFPSIAEDHSEMQERVLMVLQATGGTRASVTGSGSTWTKGDIHRVLITFEIITHLTYIIT